MIALALLLQAAAAGTPAVGALGRQDLPAQGCAAFLWSPVDHRLIAMVASEPATLRVSLDGRPVDLPRVERHGEGGYGLPGSSSYRGGTTAATLDLSVATRNDLTDGAMVPQATLRLDQPGRDTLVMPLAGMIGCRKPGG